MAALLPIAASVLGPLAVAGVRKLFHFEKGGKVPKTGAYKLHKGEVVIPKTMVPKIKAKALKVLKTRKPQKPASRKRKSK